MEDDIRDLAIQITNALIKAGLVPDCTDTDDDTEFQFQDIIVEVLTDNLEKDGTTSTL